MYSCINVFLNSSTVMYESIPSLFHTDIYHQPYPHTCSSFTTFFSALISNHPSLSSHILINLPFSSFLLILCAYSLLQSTLAPCHHHFYIPLSKKPVFVSLSHFNLSTYKIKQTPYFSYAFIVRLGVFYFSFLIHFVKWLVLAKASNYRNHIKTDNAA